jgi:hypothetical protein
MEVTMGRFRLRLLAFAATLASFGLVAGEIKYW